MIKFLWYFDKTSPIAYMLSISSIKPNLKQQYSPYRNECHSSFLIQSVISLSSWFHLACPETTESKTNDMDLDLGSCSLYRISIR